MPPATPDSTAVRVALWRALHVRLDAAPHVLVDEIGLRLANPEPGWENRPDMHPQGTRGYRASIVARARFIEDQLDVEVSKGVDQYVILGAGLDTFAQRRPDLVEKLKVFEVDQPATQAWKRDRLKSLGLFVMPGLHFVPVNFEKGDSWIDCLMAAGFDRTRPALIVSTGVSMYLTAEANQKTLRQIAQLASGSTFIMSFILTLDLIEPQEQPQHEMVYERARAAGTPFISFYTPSDLLGLACDAGFKQASHVSRADIIQRYFADRADGLVPSSGEELIVART